jgi:NDP-sugar pyrophosphorylase family protein
MLLAAGEGQRLQPLTRKLPKTMLPVGGHPVLEYNIRLLASHGLRELIINLHHWPDAITNYFGDGTQWGVSITYSYEPELMGTAGAVRKAADLLTEPFVVMYGDNLTNCDLTHIMSHHVQKGGIGTVALHYREDVTTSGMVEMDGAGRIMSFREKPRQAEATSHWVNAGILVLNSDVFDYVPPDRFCDFGHHVLPLLIKEGRPIYGFQMSEPVWWIDSLMDYQNLIRMVKKKEITLS